MNTAVWRSGSQAVGMALALLTARPPACLTAQDSLPVGYGTLKRDDILVKLDTDALQLQVLPLSEQVIRLLAPDTYRSLAALIRSKRGAIDTLGQRGGVPHPTLVLVTFIGLVPQARFTPDDVNLTSRGRLFRPVAIVPLSPTWASYQIDARQQAIAIYLFDEGISVREQLTVSYQGLSSDAWSRSILTLERERARVMGQAQAQSRP